MSVTLTVPVAFTSAELWYLRSVVRHELAAQGTWAYPPASLSLNDAIAEGLFLCGEQGQTEAWLPLSRGDCLVIDAVCDQTAKDASGQPLGAMILGKVISARHQLAAQEFEDAIEPAGLPSAQQVGSTLRELESHEHSNDPGRGTDDHAGPGR